MLWAALGVAWLGRGRGLPMMEIPPPTNAKIPIRCIKTDRSPTPRRRGTRRVREHRAPYGAPRRGAPQAFDKTSRVPRLRPHNEASPRHRGEASAMRDAAGESTIANQHPSSTGAAYPLPSTTASRRGSRRRAGWASRARSRGPQASRGCDRPGSTCPCRRSARARWCGTRTARNTGRP